MMWSASIVGHLPSLDDGRRFVAARHYGEALDPGCISFASASRRRRAVSIGSDLPAALPACTRVSANIATRKTSRRVKNGGRLKASAPIAASGAERLVVQVVVPDDTKAADAERQEPRFRALANIVGKNARFKGVATVVTSVTVEFHLSPRETQILFAAAVGQSTKETAADLGISHKTVEYFWSRIFKKLRCRSQIEVMAILLSDACERPSR
jgi:DNA-binding CsgD family transcriptional regulator